MPKMGQYQVNIWLNGWFRAASGCHGSGDVVRYLLMNSMKLSTKGIWVDTPLGYSGQVKGFSNRRTEG
jgi:hypothetical protein